MIATEGLCKTYNGNSVLSKVSTQFCRKTDLSYRPERRREKHPVDAGRPSAGAHQWRNSDRR